MSSDASDQFVAFTPECEEILDASAPLRQGDVLLWVNAQDDPWNRIAIVVTADCDLVHKKHAGAIATVPVLQYHEYLARFPVPSQLRRLEAQIRDRARAGVRKMQASHRPDRPGVMSDLAIDGWVAAAEPEQILEALGATADKAAASLRTQLEWLRESAAHESDTDLRRQLDLLARGRLVTGGKQNEAAVRLAVARENLERVEKLPGDAMFLHSVGPGLDVGYVVYLRRIENLEEGAIALRAIDLADPARLAQRIARLSSPYVFRLTQQLAQVFADIGLPGSYEARRARFVSDVAVSLGETS